MATTPKVKKETNATRLETLKKNGFVDASVKTFNKTVSKVWGEFSAAFPNGKVFRKSTLVPVSRETIPLLRGSNMLVVGDKLVFPAEGAQIKVRETARGVFIDAKRVTDNTGRRIKNGNSYTIILAKDGNHIKYARELDRKSGSKKTLKNGQLTAYGTLKTSKLQLKDGTVVETFMRDLSAGYESVEGAIMDDRYNVGAADDILEDDYDSRQEYLSDVAEVNGVHAIIRMHY